jgi:predicted RNase H-like nuclease
MWNRLKHAGSNNAAGALMLIIGIDLAWGDKKPDGVCIIEATRRSASVAGFALPSGDDALIATVMRAAARRRSVFLTVDAPIVCPNRTGTRPVDRLTHTMFHREHAACHPANLTKCPRPVRIRKKLEALGFTAGWNARRGGKTVAEVYPHPAIVRLFRLPRIIKYKKGTVAERKREFKRYQHLITKSLSREFPMLAVDGETRALLRASWSKPVEDQTDALLCALIGLWHWLHAGRRSEVIGDAETGFILLPEDLRKA